MKRSAAAPLASVASVAFVALSVAGCSGCGKSKAPHAQGAASSAASTGPRTLRRKPKSTTELRTTSADIYFANLDGTISELTRLLQDRPDTISNVLLLSANHHTRGRFRGDLDELQQGIEGTNTCARLEPENASCYVMRASQEQSLHRFREARADLERAKQLGADRAKVAEIELDLDWNDGRYELAIPAIRRARQTRPSTASWMREAQLEHDLGQEDEADAAFEAAEDMISDTGPLVVAHLDVQRGIQKAATGHLEEAAMFFRASTDRIPDYVAGNEHLAETLHAMGRDEEATKLYERVVQLSNDPEFAHALAVQYAAIGRTQAAQELDAKARARYEALLRIYPEAMYWHASEFFFAVGDVKRALELLRQNLVLRPNSTSFVALARAQLANERLDEARKSIDAALAMPVVSAALFWTASRIYRRQGDMAAADAFRAKAERIDPHAASE